MANIYFGRRKQRQEEFHAIALDFELDEVACSLLQLFVNMDHDRIIDAGVISIFDAHFPHLKDCFIVPKLTFDATIIIDLIEKNNIYF